MTLKKRFRIQVSAAKLESIEQIYRKNVHWCLHYNIEVLPQACLRVHVLVVSSLYSEYKLECMRDDNIALLVLVREMYS